MIDGINAVGTGKGPQGGTEESHAQFAMPANRLQRIGLAFAEVGLRAQRMTIEFSKHLPQVPRWTFHLPSSFSDSVKTWAFAVASITEKMREAIKPIPLTPRQVQSFEALFGPGSEHDDLMAIISNSGMKTESERLAAGRRMLTRLRKGIHPKLYQHLAPELNRYSEEHNRSIGKEIHARRLSALFAVILEAVGDISPAEYRERLPRGEWRGRRLINAKISTYIASDVLGPEWRRKVRGSRAGCKEVSLPETLWGSFRGIAGPTSPAHLLDRLVDKERLHLLLRKLPLKKAQLLVLLFIERLTTAEAATKLGITEATVRVHLSQIRKLEESA